MCKRFHERHLKLAEKSSACADFLDSSINFLAKTHVKWGSFDWRDIAVGHGRAHQREQISKIGGQVCGKCRIGCESQDGERACAVYPSQVSEVAWEVEVRSTQTMPEKAYDRQCRDKYSELIER